MAGEKRSQDQDEISLAKTVLIDIEGTTTSISFVKVKGPQRRRKRSDNANVSSRNQTVPESFSYRSIPGSGLIALVFHPRDLFRE